MCTKLNKPNVSRASILLVDDHPTVREGIAALIARQTDMEVCGKAAGVEDALKCLNDQSPDLAIVDLSLKDGHGLDLAKRITVCNTDTKVLIHSMYDESLYAERSLQAGACGYINKQEDPEILLEAIRDILKGRVFFTATTVNHMIVRSTDGASPPQGGSVDSLTDRELQVFELIGQGLTTRAIASRLDLSTHTIDTHREKIKVKLNLNNAAELTRHAVQWNLEQR